MMKVTLWITTAIHLETPKYPARPRVRFPLDMQQDRNKIASCWGLKISRKQNANDCSLSTPKENERVLKNSLKKGDQIMCKIQWNSIAIFLILAFLLGASVWPAQSQSTHTSELIAAAKKEGKLTWYTAM